jgi:hypothetical protein
MMPGTVYRLLPEEPVAGRRLGRYVAHDVRSKAFPALRSPALKSIRWFREAPILMQGDTGSCTGNAAVGMAGTRPFTRAKEVTEARALECYSWATRLDAIRGTYPPDDTGSSGLAAMRVLKKWGWIQSYRHAFGLQHALEALQHGPGITGITWRTGCDEPRGVSGRIHWRGDVRGGHELVLEGLDVEERLVILCNSWGAEWGVGGRCSMSWDDFAAALDDQGDATFAEAA